MPGSEHTLASRASITRSCHRLERFQHDKLEHKPELICNFCTFWANGGINKASVGWVLRMLVSFSVSNFKSIADEQEVTLVSARGKKNVENRFLLQTENSLAPELVSVCCILGPNGSGKSTLLEAMMFMSDFVEDSARTGQPGDEIKVTPYKFSEEFLDQPTVFEVAFLFDEELYQYGFAVNSKRVVGEWMFVKPSLEKTRTRRVFQREYDEEEGEYIWYFNESIVRGQKNTWKEATRENALFLSVAVQLNSEWFRKPFDWIVHFWRMVPGTNRLSDEYSSKKVHENKEYKTKILDLLKSSGLKMVDVVADRDEEMIKKFSEGQFKEIITDKARQQILDSLKKGADFADYKVKIIHKSEEGKDVALDLQEESDGTQSLFTLAGPIIDTLENGYTLVFDELNTALHTAVMDYIIRIFSDPKKNRYGAQLIFTTHDTNVLVANEIHEDQVYFTDMENGRRTRLIPLSDFKIRARTNIEKNYLSGRFGALPEIAD
jgi:AAA15 family ATPase/GTPase